jgi:hypothetical protein
MAIQKHLKRVNDPLRPKLGLVAGILAQSPVVVSSFGRWPAFILMMTGLTVILIVSLATIFVVGKGSLFLFG